MKEFINKYWLVLLIVVLLPFVINGFILIPSFLPFVGKDTDWLAFWGAYLGAVISSGVAFYVLHKQLDQNHSENEYNRKLQISIMEYQQKSAWLIELKAKMTDYFKAFSQNDIVLLGDLYSRHDNKKYINNEIKRMIDVMSAASFAKGLLFFDNVKDQERDSLLVLSSFEEEFYSLLEDLAWLANLLDNNRFRSDNDYAFEITKQYKNNARSKRFVVKSRRVWDIVEGYNKRISVYGIANIRIDEAVQHILADDIMNEIVKLIDYEQNEINKLIQIRGL